MKCFSTLLFSGILVLFTVFPSTARVIKVPNDYETIQAGIDASEHGDTVMVALGEYVENINFDGKSISVIGKPNIPSDVIIDGNANGSSVVVIRGANGGGSQLSGFTIQNGSTDYGGGIYCRESIALLEFLIVSDNTTSRDGGGIYITQGSGVIIREVLIQNNSASSGGGLTCFNESEVVVLNSVISDNSASNDAGGVQCSNSQLIMQNVVLSSNEVRDVGGAFTCMNGADVRIDKATIIGNQVQAFYKDDDSSVRITDSIIRENNQFIEGINDLDQITFCNADVRIRGEGNIDEEPLFVDQENGDFHLAENSPCIDAGNPYSPLDPDLTRADIGAYYFHQDNIQDIDLNLNAIVFEDVQIEESDSIGIEITNIGQAQLYILNIEIDPENSPFHITLNGEPDIVPDSSLSVWVVFSPQVVDDYQAILMIESNDPDEGLIEIELLGIATDLSVKENLLPTNTALTSIYPNPFNSTVTLNYSLATPSYTSIQIYDLSGRLIESLVSRQIQAGNHNISWSADEFSSGMYFVKMEALGFSEIRKIILTK